MKIYVISVMTVIVFIGCFITAEMSVATNPAHTGQKCRTQFLRNSSSASDHVSPLQIPAVFLSHLKYLLLKKIWVSILCAIFKNFFIGLVAILLCFSMCFTTGGVVDCGAWDSTL